MDAPLRGCTRCAYKRGAQYAENAGSISFVHASRGCQSGVADDPVILGHDAAVLGNCFTDVSDKTQLRSKHREPVYGVVSQTNGVLILNIFNLKMISVSNTSIELRGKIGGDELEGIWKVLCLI